MLGQLQDAGNTVTLAHHLQLLSSAFLVSGLNLWSGGVLRQRASSPKLIVWNNAIVSALSGHGFGEARRQPDWWGRLVENAVGGHLLNQGFASSTYYWQEAHAEVDFVVERGRTLAAIEVKSGRRSESRGLEAFKRRYPRVKAITVGAGGIRCRTSSRRRPRHGCDASPPRAWTAGRT